MRRIAVTALVFTLAAGCAGGSRSHSVREVERAFHDAGLPFRSETLPDPYLQGMPLGRWVGGSESMTRVRAGNVIVVGSGTRGQLVRLGRALATLG